MGEGQGQPAWQAAEARDWVSYYDRVAGGEPRETLRVALDRFEAGALPHSPLGVDLGCGDGRDTAELLRRGWSVNAFDDHPEGLRRLRARTDADIAGALGNGRLQIREQGFGELEVPACHLVNASFALPFCQPSGFAALWGKIVEGIGAGGRFAGQLFGDRDSWSIIEDRTHHTRSEAIGLFDDFILERFNEEERDGEDAQSQHKHWHVFHVVAQKR